MAPFSISDVVDTLLRLVGGSSVAGDGQIGAQREEQTDEADHNQYDYHQSSIH